MDRRQKLHAEYLYTPATYKEPWRFTALKYALLNQLYQDMYEQFVVPFGPFVWSKKDGGDTVLLRVTVEVVPAQQHWTHHE